MISNFYKTLIRWVVRLNSNQLLYDNTKRISKEAIFRYFKQNKELHLWPWALMKRVILPSKKLFFF